MPQRVEGAIEGRLERGAIGGEEAGAGDAVARQIGRGSRFRAVGESEQSQQSDVAGAGLDLAPVQEAVAGRAAAAAQQVVGDHSLQGLGGGPEVPAAGIDAEVASDRRAQRGDAIALPGARRTERSSAVAIEERRRRPGVERDVVVFERRQERRQRVEQTVVGAARQRGAMLGAGRVPIDAVLGEERVVIAEDLGERVERAQRVGVAVLARACRGQAVLAGEDVRRDLAGVVDGEAIGAARAVDGDAIESHREE